jgi:catalase
VDSDKAGLSHSKPQGAGGKTHHGSQNGEILTTASGMPIADKQNKLRQATHDPALLEDADFREKPFYFDQEGISQLVVHARGADQFIEEFRKFRFWAGEAASDLGAEA